MADIVMPRLSDTMEEGTILRWLGRDGEEIERGQELVEIETDKATMVYESDQQGTLEILAQEGQTLAVGELIARVGSTGTERELAPASAASAASADGEGPTPAGPAALPAGGIPPQADSGAAPVSARAEVGGRVKASPLARRIARERGIDLGGLAGSGPGGRIVKADVQASLQGSARGPAPSQEAAPGATAAGTPGTTSAGTPGAEAPGGLAAQLASAKGETTEVELSRTQQTIARRMAESKATIPHFALEVEVDMEECVALRAELKRVTGAGETIPTYNDMVVKACALALRAHPRANSSYRDGRVQLHSRVNVGVAVATEGQGPQGGTLIVPTVFDAERKALGEIAREARALAARVRDGSITPPELSGGTFTVSNLGMFGVRSFTAIINPPQAAILSVGMVRAMPVARDRGILLRHTMSLTLACDHRILYGADAARFLGHIRDLLERPAALTL
jgi:pyruvate dehydrogenase E2 component (dihydrolipoamide acetyltransferase)